MIIVIPKSSAALTLSRLVFLIGFALVFISTVETAEKLPPELAALDTQFLALQAERVTDPYEAGVKSLIAGYLDRLKKLIAEEKAVGHLDGVVALNAEHEQVVSKSVVPETDDDATPENLRALRAIYREAHAKLVATRAQNLETLTGPLSNRLLQMEGDFTKADRVADALIVREYREALGEGSAGTSSRTEATGEVATADKSVRAPVKPATTLALRDGVVNSLGMKFLPVKGTDVLFCIHEVRYKDYAAYAAEAQTGGGLWKNQSIDGFTPTDRPEDHPVIRVSWDDAQKFCAWLSKKEGKVYRLPKDQEWSIAVGIGRDEKWTSDTTPASVSKDQEVFPWGKEWPPPKGAGNYKGVSSHAEAGGDDRPSLEGYGDTFPTTAPVMSFEPNTVGLYDMGGNVWEWIEDFYDNAKTDHVLRGGSWPDLERGLLLSSTRIRGVSGKQGGNYGFRIVLVPSEG